MQRLLTLPRQRKLQHSVFALQRLAFGSAAQVKHSPRAELSHACQSVHLASLSDLAHRHTLLATTNPCPAAQHRQAAHRWPVRGLKDQVLDRCSQPSESVPIPTRIGTLALFSGRATRAAPPRPAQAQFAVPYQQRRRACVASKVPELCKPGHALPYPCAGMSMFLCAHRPHRRSCPGCHRPHPKSSRQQ